jgi:putative spermidine/putrescine transport system substrate-binding protein
MDTHYDSNASRRDFLRQSFWLGTGLATLNSCRKSPDANPGALSELLLYGTGTLDIEKNWAQVEKDISVKLLFTDNGNDVGPVISEMVAGSAATDYDIGGLQGGAEQELAQAKMILPWDMSKIPNYGGVWQWAIKDMKHIFHEGKQYGIPSVVNADSVIYLEKETGKVDSYHAVFDPKFKGRTSMEDAWINSVIFAAIYLKENNIQKIDNPGDLTTGELGAVMEFLIKMKRDGQFLRLWSGWEDGLNLIKSRQVCAMTGWEPIVYAARKDVPDVMYASPREGYEGWSNNLVLHKGARARGREDVAHKFVDWELSGFYGFTLAAMRGYCVPSDQTADYAKKMTSENGKKVSEILSHVESKFRDKKGATYWQNVRPTQHKLYDEWWSKLRAA